jgi:hypothetical protein
LPLITIRNTSPAQQCHPAAATGSTREQQQWHLLCRCNVECWTWRKQEARFLKANNVIHIAMENM